MMRKWGQMLSRSSAVVDVEWCVLLESQRGDQSHPPLVHVEGDQEHGERGQGTRGPRDTLPRRRSV
eukprot:46791-Eustigmatos_ZCMA.PRE.1